MAKTFDRPFPVIAADHGWTKLPTSYFSYWSFEFSRGSERLLIRVARNGRVTALTHIDGSGVILEIQRDKRQAAVEILSTPDPRPAHRDVSNPGGLKFCACGQGFSGAAAESRLADHIANPDPMSTGALLIAAMR